MVLILLSSKDYVDDLSVILVFLDTLLHLILVITGWSNHCSARVDIFVM
jgi:NADH:ubiquinone oxidoreductase subunit 4 (subunit M)